MNYKTYQSLTTEQKQEYDFRFRYKQPEFNLSGLMLTFTLLISTFGIMLMICYLSVNSESPYLVTYREQISEYIPMITSSLRLLLIIIALFVIDYLVRMLYYIITYMIWFKKNNIKSIYWWTKNDNKLST